MVKIPENKIFKNWNGKSLVFLQIKQLIFTKWHLKKAAIGQTFKKFYLLLYFKNICLIEVQFNLAHPINKLLNNSIKIHKLLRKYANL